MAFPPDFLDDLRSRLPLSAVVGRRVRLLRAGREFKACCPFHQEKTPSFTLNDQKGFFHCFGCGAHGDIVGFVMRHDNLSFVEAVERLAGEAGVAVPQPTPQARARYDHEKTLYAAVDAASVWFQAQLRGTSAGRQAWEYLVGRGLDAETIASFQLGYAPADGGALRQSLLAQGFAEPVLIEAGLLRQPDDGRAAYSFFRHRVMFPVADRRGRVVAFGGRLLHGDGPKYINSAETPIFHKGKTLYGLSRARQAVTDGAPVVVVEGYMDVIALAKAGFGGAVAPLGTALTEQQIETLWRLFPPGTERVPVLCFDGDAAGRRAAARAAARILPLLVPSQSACFAYLPQGHDPDSLIRVAGRDAMQDVIARARPLVDVLWEQETRGRRFETPEARAGLEVALDGLVDQIADRPVQRFYRDEMRRRVREAFFWRPRRGDPRRAFRPGGGWIARGDGQDVRGGGPGSAPGNFVPETRHVRSPLARQRRLLVQVLVCHPALFEEFEDVFLGLETGIPTLDAVRDEAIALLSAHPDLDAVALQDGLRTRGFGPALEEVLADCSGGDAAILAPEAPSEQVRDMVRDILRRSVRPKLQDDLTHAKACFSAAPTDENLARLLAIRRELAGEDGSDPLA